MQKNKIFKLFVQESDPEVQEWLKTVSEADYEFVSKFQKEMRHDPGTRSKMILHRALKAYSDDQLSKERETTQEWKVMAENYERHGIDTDKQLQKEREMRKELVSTINQLTRGSAFLEKKVEFLIKRASELDKNK